MTDAATALQEQTAASLERLRDEAVTQVVAGLHDRWPVDSPSLGIAGGPDCRADAQFHLDFLVGSVFAGTAQPFTEYLAWLAAALGARGIKLDILRETLALLRGVFQAHLPSAEWAVLEPILRSGDQALAYPAALVRSYGPSEDAARPQTTALTPRSAPETLAAALIGGDRKRAADLISEATEQAGYAGMARDLVQPAMYRIGEWWHQRRVSVAQEHLASAVLQMLLAHQAAASPAIEDASNRRALFACVAHNHHQIGLRIVADVFELNGWEVQFLGADVPTDDIVAQVEHIRPDVLGLSASLVRHIPVVADVHRRVRAALSSAAPRVIIGGLGVNRLHGIAQRLAVDGWYPDAQSVLGAVR